MRFLLHAPLARTCVLVLGGLLLTGSAAFGQADSLAYGELPHQPIVSARPGRFTLFDKAFYRNQLFLLGESHGAQKPQEIDFELLKHLNEKTGLRYYLAELDATKARYVNAYLKTGDEALLTDVFRSWVVQKAQWANTDFVAKLRKIRALNQTLPPNRPIQFVGIDRIHDKALVAEELGQLLAGQQLPPAARPLADSLTHQLTQQTPDSLAARWALNWLAKWADQEAVYQQALGRQAPVVRELLTNIGYLRTIRSRETILFTNFKTLLPSLPNEKLYGLWGFFHVLQSAPLKSGKPFACLVRESDLYLHDKVVSLSCSYLDSYMMTPTAFLPPMWQDKGKAYTRLNKFNNDGELMHVEGIEAMRAATQANTTTLFALNGPGSFARRTPLRIRYSPYMPPSQQIQFDPQRAITDYFQYIILVRNSEMTQPIAP